MSTDNDDEITVYAKPHLDPQDVRSLAASIPNCSQVNPPNECTIPHTTVKPTESSSSYFSSSDGSYFSSFSRRLQQTFSSEQDDENNKDGSSGKAKSIECHHHEVVSFLVSDAYSIEKLAAEAEGKHGSMSELEGAGIARVDVYCKSGLVITCRLIQTNEADGPAADGDNGVKKNSESVSSPGSSFMQILPTPRKGNVTKNSLSGGTQLRRIIRRKCTLEGLKRILEDPPKLPEIDSVTMEDDNTDDDDDDDDASQSSTVSKKLLQRKQQRLSASKKKSYKSLFGNKQQDFLQKQQIKYEKRIMRDEKVRQHVGNAILAAGMEGGCEAMYLTPFKSMSLEEKDNKNATTDQMIESELSSSSIISHTPGSEAYHCQKAIQDKIEVADMGLAILMGEAQRLEKMMETIKKEKGLGDEENEENGKESSLGSGNKHSRSVGGGYDTDRSFSTFQSTDRDVGSDDDDADESSDSEDSMDSQQRQAVKARKMQGCDVEYSFPNELHDELEAALMNEQDEDDDDDDDDDDSSSSDCSDDESRDVEESRRRGRGRSPPKNNGKSGGSGGKQPRSEEISPIVAIPTNGEGCIILRENGTFDVIGKSTIPHMLEKELFRKNGPLPDKIFLGSKGRYFVQFKDGSYHFYGPPELGKLLSKLDKQRRETPKKDRARTRRADEVSVVCIAFGKELDDFFVVYSDGSWNANGCDLPKGIEKLMRDRRGIGDLTWVAIGDKGEWCVRSMNGGVWWKHVSEEADEALTFVLSHYCENDLEYIDFGGADGSFFLLHK